MAEVFVARQPIFDPALDVTAYELLFRGSNAFDRALVSDNDEATSTVVINAFTELGLDTVVGDRRAWVNVTREFLLDSMAFALPRDRVVLELLEDQVVDQELLNALDLLRADGYKIALDDFAWSPGCELLLPHVDIVKVEVLGRDPAAVAEDVDRLRPYNHTLLAEKLETRQDYERCLELGFELFQGYFFCKPETLSARGVAPNRLALLQLMSALQDQSIEFSQLETLISRDVALSYRLLRYINSAFFGLRHEVTSIGRAVALLGLENVRRWSTLTAFATIDDKPRELMTTALVRGRFCELVGDHFGEPDRDQLFTLGLFSVVDALMDAPMHEALRSIPFPEDMTHALVAGHGSKGRVLECAIACERGRLEEAPRGTASAGELAAAHADALAWATSATRELAAQRVAA